MEDHETFQKAVQELHRNGDWQGIIKLYEQGMVDTNILWYRPCFEAIQFLKDSLSHFCMKGVASVGCGTGLLEWLINMSTGLPVKGYEVDAGWWESKYCPPKFWPHIECVDVDSLPDIDDDDALLFCYFNNLAAFDRYLNKFNGSCIVLIGPGEGSGRHCDPSPFYLRNDANWDVHSVHDNAFNDAIVVYKRVVL